MAKSQFVQRFGSGASLALVAVCGLALMTAPVVAQFGGQFGGRGGGGGGSGGFFDLFGPGPRYAPREREQDFTKAPPARRLENQPATSVMVFGDSMADWLAYGLEDAAGDNPDMAVVRKNRATAGLIRYDTRNEAQDWPQVIREAFAQSPTKPNFVVMMIGLNDRTQMRERPLQVGPPSAAAPAAGTPPSLVPQPGAPAPPAAVPADAERPASDSSIVAPERQANAPGLRTYEFRTEEWAEHYIRRIDATVTALKAAGVPVFWVGLPSIRGPKSTSEMLYLNDLYRTRAEKAGVTYIDVWDGFVDESGRFAVQGPDFEGQIRRLRVSDGVHFTKSGARKLAHYLEREVRRMMQRGTELVAIPAEPQAPAPSGRPGAATARPLSGPVVPLTASATASQELLGAADFTANVNPRGATRVLIKGESVNPPAGRSDDFRWPRRGVAAFGTDPAVATTTDPVPVVAAPAPAIAAATPAGADPKASSTLTPGRKTTGRSQQQQQQARPPQPVQRQAQPQRRDNFGGGGFGGFR
jgi:hypothetical protein